MKDENENRNKLYRNLSILLKLFKNRPNHLAKYLIENSAFSDEFIYNIISSSKLNDMTVDDSYNYFTEENNLAPIYFNDFNEMSDFYLDIIETKSHTIDNEDMIVELNYKLKKLVDCERFEEAYRLKLYMNKHNIPINI